MKKYILLTVTSFILILIASVATFSLFDANKQILDLSRLFNQPVASHRFFATQPSEAEARVEPNANQVIRVQLPAAYLQEQLALVLVAAPFGLEIRDYEHASERVCAHDDDAPVLVSPAQGAVEPIADWGQIQDEIPAPTEPYIISLWHPSPTLDDYVLETDQGDFLEMQPDPTVACATSTEDTQLAW
jgi:hypothetical protein